MRKTKHLLITIVALLCSMTVSAETYPDWESGNTSHGSSQSYTYTLKIESIYKIKKAILSFDWKVSSEANYDNLIVTLDGTTILTKSGEDKGSFSMEIENTSDSYTLIVKYSKDSNISNGGDYAKVYNLNLVASEGPCGEKHTWKFTNGHLLIEGSGDMPNYTYLQYDNGPTPWYDFRNSIKTVTIGDGITSIGSEAFCYCNNLTSISIPNSVTSLGDYAFYGCSNLKTITIPEGVTSIENSVFSYCTSLASIEVPEGVTSIGGGAFMGCSNLVSIAIPEGVTSIGRRAFYGCSSLVSIAIPEGVTSIGDRTFDDCNNLVSIAIPKSIERIGAGTFEDTAWYKALYGNQYNGGVYIGKVLYDYIGTMPNNTSFIVREGTKSISGSTFEGCTGLSSISIPGSVVYIGDYAFNGCRSLKEVILEDGKETLYLGLNFRYEDDSDYDRGLFYDCPLTTVHLGRNLEISYVSPFEGISSLTTISISPNVTRGRDVFDNTGWYEDQANGIVYVGEVLYGFKGDMPVNTSIEIKEGTKSIFCDAFSDCDNLISVTTPKSLVNIGSFAFYNCNKLASITIPEGVTSIENSAFRDCNNLVSIVIPDSVTCIGDHAFYGCSSLTCFTISENSRLTDIGTLAFYWCDNLTYITIPKNVKNIGDAAFNCDRLSDVYCYAKTIPSTNLYSFHNPEKATLHVPTYALENYRNTKPWSSFGNIVAMETKPQTITLNQYGSGTYCSEYALDFSEVEGLKAYAATGYNTKTCVVTLTRVMTSQPGMGLFLKGAPGEYTIPTLEYTDDNSLNMLVGLIENTTINATSSDGLYHNFRYTIKSGDETPLFYQVEEAGFTLSAGKAYLQIPAEWMPATESRSISLRFDEDGTTDIGDAELNIQSPVQIFDLMGRRVIHPQKGGVYIINGKKTVIK